MKQNTPRLGTETRAVVAETLLLALGKTLQSYKDFINNHSDESHVDYKNNQTAARAGLAHIELLIKMAGTVDLLDDDETQDILAMISKAQTELESLNA